MCGIFGYNWNNNDTEHIAMNGLLHRGPDSQNIVRGDYATLGHLRLKIIDLSDLANQPFTTEDKQIYAATNGVIYNYDDLKKMLSSKGYRFKSNGDCEVIPHLYKEFGVDGLKLLDGQFALAIWDKINRSFILYRDPQGIKPLYYYCSKDKFVFASEAHVVADIANDNLVNENAIEYIKCYGYNAGDESHYKNVYLLKPGYVLVFKENYLNISNLNSLKDVRIRNCSDLTNIRENILDLISNGVKKTLISDKPIAVIVSGGLDSSIILDRIAHHGEKVVAFSIGEVNDNEFDYARYITKHYGIPLKEILLNDYDVDRILAEVISRPCRGNGGLKNAFWI